MKYAIKNRNIRSLSKYVGGMQQSSNTFFVLVPLDRAMIFDTIAEILTFFRRTERIEWATPNYVVVELEVVCPPPMIQEARELA